LRAVGSRQWAVGEKKFKTILLINKIPGSLCSWDFCF
jgi:hypothetical protein